MVLKSYNIFGWEMNILLPFNFFFCKSVPINTPSYIQRYLFLPRGHSLVNLKFQISSWNYRCARLILSNIHIVCSCGLMIGTGNRPYVFIFLPWARHPGQNAMAENIHFMNVFLTVWLRIQILSWQIFWVNFSAGYIIFHVACLLKERSFFYWFETILFSSVYVDIWYVCNWGRQV